MRSERIVSHCTSEVGDVLVKYNHMLNGKSIDILSTNFHIFVNGVRNFII